MLEVTSSPNLGMFIDPRTRDISCFSCTEQLFESRLIHSGNRYPAAARSLPAMISAAEQFTRHFRDCGVTGHLGFDFCEHTSPSGGPGYILAEINPRLNGATYCQALFNALNRRRMHSDMPPLGAYLALTIPTSCRTFRAVGNHDRGSVIRPRCRDGRCSRAPQPVGLRKVRICTGGGESGGPQGTSPSTHMHAAAKVRGLWGPALLSRASDPVAQRHATETETRRGWFRPRPTAAGSGTAGLGRRDDSQNSPRAAQMLVRLAFARPGLTSGRTCGAAVAADKRNSKSCTLG